MNQIGILGAGLMGHGLAQVFAAAGCLASVFDHNAGTLSSLKNRVRQNLDVFEQEALVSKEAADLCLDRIVLSDSLYAMCQGRDCILEAFSLVEQGIASVEDVDKVVRNAFGLRLAFLGPLETADLAGLDLTHHIQQDLLPRLEASPTPSALLKEKVDRGNLGAKSGEGFHRWPAEKLKRLIERRDRILLGIANLVRSG